MRLTCPFHLSMCYPHPQTPFQPSLGPPVSSRTAYSIRSPLQPYSAQSWLTNLRHQGIKSTNTAPGGPAVKETSPSDHTRAIQTVTLAPPELKLLQQHTPDSDTRFPYQFPLAVSQVSRSLKQFNLGTTTWCNKQQNNSLS